MTENISTDGLLRHAAIFFNDSDEACDLVYDLAAALIEAQQELVKAWDAGWSTGERWSFYGDSLGPRTRRDLEITVNPYRTAKV